MAINPDTLSPAEQEAEDANDFAARHNDRARTARSLALSSLRQGYRGTARSHARLARAEAHEAARHATRAERLAPDSLGAKEARAEADEAAKAADEAITAVGGVD